jgi:ribonuclease Z
MRLPVLYCAIIASFVSAAAPAAAQRTRVVMLGSGTPNADPDHSGPAVAIVVNGQSYLVDAGPGVVRRAAAAQQADSVPGLAMPQLKRVFITHLHSDHTVGLPDLILTPWVLGRTDALEVYGPPRTKRMVDLLSEAYADDIDVRLHGGEPSNKTGYRAIAHDVQPGIIYRDSNVTVTAFKVAHGKWENSYGYVFQTRDRKIVVSGDTGPTDAVVKACDGCDVLVHEVYSAAQLATRTPDWRAYHSSYHTSGIELGDLAMRARARAVVLYHQLFWNAPESEVVGEIRKKYSGTLIVARDLGVY